MTALDEFTTRVEKRAKANMEKKADTDWGAAAGAVGGGIGGGYAAGRIAKPFIAKTMLENMIPASFETGKPRVKALAKILGAGAGIPLAGALGGGYLLSKLLSSNKKEASVRLQNIEKRAKANTEKKAVSAKADEFAVKVEKRAKTNIEKKAIIGQALRLGRNLLSTPYVKPALALGAGTAGLYYGGKAAKGWADKLMNTGKSRDVEDVKDPTLGTVVNTTVRGPQPKAVTPPQGPAAPQTAQAPIKPETPIGPR